MTFFPDAWKRLKEEEAPFLVNQREEMARLKPLQGVRILHNSPLSLEAICKIDVLIQGGAVVGVLRNQAIAPATQNVAIAKLKEQRIPYFDSPKEVRGTWDVALDCGAELKHQNVTYGIVELTATGAHLYRRADLKTPVVSIDDSQLKTIETIYGTGAGVCEAIKHWVKKPLTGLRFVLFGYGKVGKGIAMALQKEGAWVSIVDRDPLVRESAIQPVLDPLKKEFLHSILRSADGIITATAQKDAISQSYKNEVSLMRGKILVNAGVEDEFGSLFLENEVLNQKQPINFSLDSPTPMRYLDLSFWAHNQGALWLVQGRFSPGFHPFPEDVDDDMVEAWANHWGEKYDSIIFK